MIILEYIAEVASESKQNPLSHKLFLRHLTNYIDPASGVTR